MAALSPFSSAPLRIIKRSLLDTRWQPRPLYRSITTFSSTDSADAMPVHTLRSRAHPIPERDLPTTPKEPSGVSKRLVPSKRRKGPPISVLPESNDPRSAPLRPVVEHTDNVVDGSVQEYLPLVRSQPPYYVQVHIHENPYLVTAGDTVRLPFLMHGVDTGDVLRLNRITMLGSRDYTLKAGLPKEGAKHGWLDERLFECRARVMGTEMEPMRVMEKTKRRQRHIKHVYSKHRYTILKIMEVRVNDVSALEVPLVEEAVVGGQGVLGGQLGSAEPEHVLAGEVDEEPQSEQAYNLIRALQQGMMNMQDPTDQKQSRKMDDIAKELGEIKL